MTTTAKDILYGQNYIDQMWVVVRVGLIKNEKSPSDNLCDTFIWRMTRQGYNVWRERFFALGGTPQRLGYASRPNPMDD